MPLVAAAVCPHPPLLIPWVAAGAAPELDDLRKACDRTIRDLLAARPDRLVMVGSGPEPTGAEVGRPDVALSVAIGAWLLDRAGATATARIIATDASPTACVAAGRWMRDTDRVSLLVMGDGSACRGPKSPGYDDPRAEPFDAAVATALGAADPVALAGLDPELATELRCAGRAPWQVLAALLAADGRDWVGDLRYHAAPYGVGYFVASLRPPAPGRQVAPGRPSPPPRLSR